MPEARRRGSRPSARKRIDRGPGWNKVLRAGVRLSTSPSCQRPHSQVGRFFFANRIQGRRHIQALAASTIRMAPALPLSLEGNQAVKVSGSPGRGRRTGRATGRTPRPYPVRSHAKQTKAAQRGCDRAAFSTSQKLPPLNTRRAWRAGEVEVVGRVSRPPGKPKPPVAGR